MKNQRVQAGEAQEIAGRPGEFRAAPGEPLEHAHTSDLASAPRQVDDSRAHWSRLLGLHPLVAFGMIAVDMMLFGGESATLGVGLMVTIPVALALAIPCILLQRYSFKDDWGTALGKGLLVGVLTAITFPIGSPLTLVGGVLGLRGLKKPTQLASIKTRILPDSKP